MDKKTKMITGAGGFIGGHLVADVMGQGFSNIVAVVRKHD